MYAKTANEYQHLTISSFSTHSERTPQSGIVGKNEYQQDAQLSQRDRAAGCVIVFAKSRRLELVDNDLRTL